MKRPWISCNLAISADGKISSVGHRPANWTSDADLQRLKQLRKAKDALMVGRGTLETDRMTMTVGGDEPQPLRCIVSHHGELSADHPIFTSEGGDIHLLATEGYRGDLGDRVRVHESSLADFLQSLHQQFGVERLHCEGGGQLIRELAELDAIDQLHLTWAGHTLLGGAESPTLCGVAWDHLMASKTFKISEFEHRQDSGECFLTYLRSAQ